MQVHYLSKCMRTPAAALLTRVTCPCLSFLSTSNSCVTAAAADRGETYAYDRETRNGQSELCCRSIKQSSELQWRHWESNTRAQPPKFWPRPPWQIMLFQTISGGQAEHWAGWNKRAGSYCDSFHCALANGRAADLRAATHLDSLETVGSSREPVWK